MHYTKTKTWIAVLLLLVLITFKVIAQGPLTNAMNLRVRTDSNGYLLTAMGGYSGADGPLTTLGNVQLRTDSNGYLLTTLSSATPALFPDGTSPAPSIAFASEPTLGFYRSSAALMGLSGALTTSGQISSGTNVAIGATGFLRVAGRVQYQAAGDGLAVVTNSAVTIGAEFKVDALPTIASGFGTSPSITAGSTPFAGAIAVGTGGVATTGTINFNGTAFPSTPACVVSTILTNAVTRVLPSATQLVFNTTTAWVSGDGLYYICVSSK